MPEDIIPFDLENPIYKNLHIQLATFFGGPLAATWLIAENFKQLGQNEKIKNSWIWGIAIFIVFIALVFTIPESWHIPNYMIPLICLGLASVITKKLQGERIQQHILDGGRIYSAWRAIGIGIICLVITVAVIFTIAVIQNRINGNMAGA